MLLLRRIAVALSFILGCIMVTAPASWASPAVAVAHIYWGNYGSDGTGNSIGKADLSGQGVNQSFVTGASGPVGVAVSGGYVYWSNPSVAGGSPGTTIGR